MVKKILFVTIIVFTTACKSIKVNSDSTLKPLSIKKIINGLSKSKNADFDKVRGKVEVVFSKNGRNNQITLSFRMQKDSIIWLAAPFSLAKIMITPSKISYYNKLENGYFEVSFQELSERLGVGVDYDVLQNILLGNTLMPVNHQFFSFEVKNNRYLLKSKEISNTKVNIFLNQYLNIDEFNYQNREFGLFGKYQNFEQGGKKHFFPRQVVLDLLFKNKNTYTLKINYKNIEKNSSLKFPYNIPKGYKFLNVL